MRSRELAAAFEDFFAFGSFQISHEAVLVLPQIFVGALDLPVAGSLIHLANDEAQNVFFQRFCGFSLERFQIADGSRVLDAAASCHTSQVGLSRRGTGLADTRAAVNLIVEDKNYQVRGI